MARTEAEKAAQRRYAKSDKGRKARQKTVWKSHAKGFIKEYATLNDLKELQMLIEEKEKSLKKQQKNWTSHIYVVVYKCKEIK